MNPIGELLRPEDIDLDVDVSSKSELFDRVAAIVARRQGLPRGPVLDALADRERLGSTALGHGVAIPHARMKQLLHPAGAFVRTRCPIPFDAPDGRPVSNVLTLLVPATATDRHLELMANAASMFGDRAFRGQLRNCTTADEVEALIAGWPAASTEPVASAGSAPMQGD
jgi:PTS system nitrogen regulatory IIA component